MAIHSGWIIVEKLVELQHVQMQRAKKKRGSRAYVYMGLLGSAEGSGGRHRCAGKDCCWWYVLWKQVHTGRPDVKDAEYLQNP